MSWWIHTCVRIGLLLGISAQPGFAQQDAASFDCLIEPRVVIDLGVEIQGVIDDVLVSRGERVAKGQSLVVLKSTVERANLEQALDRAQMDSEIEARKADLALARQVLDRQEDLLRQDLTPQQAVDEARSNYRVSEAALTHARDNAAIAQHELLRAEALYRQRFIASPIDGTVVRRHAEPGELVTDTPVLTLAQLNVLRVEAVLPAEYLGLFTVGGAAVVIPETDPNLRLDAAIEAIDPMLDAASGTFGIALTLDNQDRSIYAGQECQVHFESTAVAG